MGLFSRQRDAPKKEKRDMSKKTEDFMQQTAKQNQTYDFLPQYKSPSA